MKFTLKSIGFVLCMFIVGSDVWAESNEFWTKYFEECSTNWSKSCDKVYWAGIDKDCKEKQKREDKRKIKRKFPVCMELTEGR